MGRALLCGGSKWSQAGAGAQATGTCSPPHAEAAHRYGAWCCCPPPRVPLIPWAAPEGGHGTRPLLQEPGLRSAGYVPGTAGGQDTLLSAGLPSAGGSRVVGPGHGYVSLGWKGRAERMGWGRQMGESRRQLSCAALKSDGRGGKEEGREEP